MAKSQPQGTGSLPSEELLWKYDVEPHRLAILAVNLQTSVNLENRHLLVRLLLAELEDSRLVTRRKLG